jgi:outer membrane biosynthesis protein TonB
MLFEKDEDLDLQPKRTKTLLISIGIHVFLLVFLAFNPELLTSPPKRIIKVMGQDYDLSREELTELVVPPDALRPKPVPEKPLVQPPAPKPQETPPPPQVQPPPPQVQPPPPPPPPQPAPQMPPVVIRPDDVLKEGARPDAQPKASRGDTTEQARAGSQEQQQQNKQEPPPKPVQQQAENRPVLALNTNPNALRVPGGNIMDSARRTVEQQIDQEHRRSPAIQGGRTGLPNGTEDPDFSTEEPRILSDTRGYDFGPYMNQVVNRVRNNWYGLIPEIARLGKRGKVVIVFTITKNGIVANEHQVANSGDTALDRAAFGSISLSNPFAQLPTGFDGDHLDLQFTFLYNIR